MLRTYAALWPISATIQNVSVPGSRPLADRRRRGSPLLRPVVSSRTTPAPGRARRARDLRVEQLDLQPVDELALVVHRPASLAASNGCDGADSGRSKHCPGCGGCAGPQRDGQRRHDPRAEAVRFASRACLGSRGLNCISYGVSCGVCRRSVQGRRAIGQAWREGVRSEQKRATLIAGRRAIGAGWREGRSVANRNAPRHRRAACGRAACVKTRAQRPAPHRAHGGLAWPNASPTG